MFVLAADFSKSRKCVSLSFCVPPAYAHTYVYSLCTHMYVWGLKIWAHQKPLHFLALPSSCIRSFISSSSSLFLLVCVSLLHWETWKLQNKVITYQPHKINYSKHLHYLIFTIVMLIVFKLHYVIYEFSLFSFSKERNPHTANKIMLTINFTSNPTWF